MPRLFLVAVLVAGIAAACSGGGNDDSATPTSTAGIPSPTQPARCAGRPPAESDSSHTLSSGRIARTYLLHLPPTYDDHTPAPLVIAFHGYGSNPEEMAALSGLTEAVDEAGMVAVFPAGTGEQLAWNVEQFGNAPDDVAFVEDLLDTLERHFCVDPERVYLAGFSNGGAMAYLAACTIKGRIAAIAVVGGYTRCEKDVPLIAFHGTRDPSVPFDGFIPLAGAQGYPPIPQLVAAWAAANGCQPDPSVSNPAADVTLSNFTRCAQGDGAVQLYAVEGGGHTWPGSEVSVPGGGPTTQSIDATALMLEFFARFKVAP